MYAIIQTGGKQYKVQPGDRIQVEKLDKKVGETVKFDRVLAVQTDQAFQAGTPTVKNAKVTATVVGQTRNDKIIVFKYKRKKQYKRKTGHRQDLTVLKIEEIRS